jgi:NAD(P)-dependent dehydrogenase (short-subunit alcohol dehydrogenase family)
MGNSMLLKNKVAIVSGVGPGMGQQIALSFAREGADVVLGARNEEALKGFKDEIETLTGRRALAVPFDFTDDDARRRLVEATRAEFGGVDILANNAAHGGNYKTLVNSKLDSWRKTMEFNFFSSLELTQLVIPLMAGREGRIIMTNSTGGLYARPAGGAYGASKAALAYITKTLAQELGPLGIRVNSVHPGPIWAEHLIEYYHQQAELRGISFDDVVAEQSARAPLGYIPTPAEISGVAVFFASDLARGVTGQCVVVDSGASL